MKAYVAAIDTRTGKIAWKRDRNIDYGTDDGDGLVLTRQKGLGALLHRR